MKRIFAIAIAVSFFGFLSAAQAQDAAKMPEAETPVQKDVKLPELETTVVFTMEYTGGFRPPNPGNNAKKPALQIFADGRVVAPSRRPNEEDNEFQMTPEQLQAFLKKVVNENKFYELDTDKIKDDIAAEPPIAMIADAPSLKISMELPQGKNSVRANSPRSAAKQLPKVKSVNRIANIEDLGRRLTLVASAGGYETIERALTKVNEQLKEKKLDLMTVNEIYTAGEKDGILTINFNRKYYNENGRWKDWINAKFTVDGDKENVDIKTNIGKEKKNGAPARSTTKPAKS